MHMLNLPWIVGVPAGGPDCDVPAALELCRKAQENGQRVIAASVAVEKELEKVINARIAGTPGQVNGFFAEHVLSADWFTFSAKRKLVFTIFAEFEHLTGQDKSDLEKILAKVISFRNRFAHGHFVVRQGAVFISYFENSLREDTLDDEYWLDIEEKFNSAIKLIAKGQKSMGLPVGWGLDG